MSRIAALPVSRIAQSESRADPGVGTAPLTWQSVAHGHVATGNAIISRQVSVIGLVEQVLDAQRDQHAVARIPVEIARVAGNTVQTFFTGLALANVVSVFRFKSSQEITRVINSYRLVIDAIAAGDEGRARRQTYQHLRDNYAPYLQVRSEDQIKLKLAQSA